MEKTHGKAAAGGPSEVVDCGAGWAKLQLASEAAAGGPGDRPCNPEFQRGEIASNNRLKTPVGGEAAVGEIPSLTGEFLGETHRILEHTQTHPLRKQLQKGPI